VKRGHRGEKAAPSGGNTFGAAPARLSPAGIIIASQMLPSAVNERSAADPAPRIGALTSPGELYYPPSEVGLKSAATWDQDNAIRARRN
jgi:hypothetical protein